MPSRFFEWVRSSCFYGGFSRVALALEHVMGSIASRLQMLVIEQKVREVG